MKFTYQTAVVTLVQFLTLTALGVPNALVSIISVCHSDNSNCVSNMIVSLIFFLLTAAWFGFILFLGYTAQKKRSRRLAFILIGCEFATFLTAGFFNFPRDTDLLQKATSLIDALLSLWVIFLAYHLLRAGNRRIVKKTGRHSKQDLEL